MRIETEAREVAIVGRNTVKFLKIVKSDQRGKLTLEDGSEWNARNGRKWGQSNPKGYVSIFTETLQTKEQGERTVAYRAEQAAAKEREAQYRETVAKIGAVLGSYPANSVEDVRAKIAAARAELDKLEVQFS